MKPPSFRITGGTLDKAGKCWYAEAVFETPKGPVKLAVTMDLPEAMRALYDHFRQAIMVKKIANQIIAGWAYPSAVIETDMAGGDDAAGWGFHLPNPLHAIKSVANTVTRVAHAAANGAVAGLSGAARAAAAKALVAIKTAANPAALTAAIKNAASKLGSLKIPGTNIPLTALNVLGAAVIATRQIAGPGLTRAAYGAAFSKVLPAGLGDMANDLAMKATGDNSEPTASMPAVPTMPSAPQFPGMSSNVPDLSVLASAGYDESAIRNAYEHLRKHHGKHRHGRHMHSHDEAMALCRKVMSSGAIAKKVIPKLVQKKAAVAAKAKAKDPKFAREMGIPTLDVKPEYYAAARTLVPILRGLYKHDKGAIAKMEALKKQITSAKTLKEKAEARTVWQLAAQISEQAHAAYRKPMPRAHGDFAAGDGYGPGYGQAGYVPPPSPMHNAFAQLHG